MRSRSVLLTAVVLTIAVLGPAAAQSWNVFSAASITGVTVTPNYSSGTLQYEYALAPGATVDGKQVVQLLGVYALGEPQAATFNANGANVEGWKFVSKANAAGYIAGWESLGDESRIDPGETKTLNFSDFDITNGTVVAGWHFRYVTNAQKGWMTTAYFKAPPVPGTPAIPEPTALVLALVGGGASGLLRLVRRRQT